jgi:4-amino-4-deoxychorismate lyase
MNSRALKILVNGEVTDSVPATDRSVLFGDGVFETLTVRDGEPQFWLRHMARLQAGCHQLGIAQIDEQQLRREADSLIQGAESAQGTLCVLKIIISRGEGTRGYRPDPAAVPTRIIQLHAWPNLPALGDGVRTTVCTLRLGTNPQLAGIKHLNRLEQVLARAEWSDADIAEGLLFDHAGRVIEGTMSNLFLVFDGALATPDLSRCGVAGIMRGIVLEIAEQQGLAVSVRDISKAELFQADELFLCNSLIGIWPVLAVDSNRYATGAVTARLQSLLTTFNDDRRVWHS